jgi:phosphatidylglycerol---prolipoprotein diacylglyceryl transferase
MCPTIIIDGAAISSWHAFMLAGAVVSIALAVYLMPRDFTINRLSVLSVGAMLFLASLIGARLLFILLGLSYHQPAFSRIISARGGFAYFGALAFSVITIYTYAKVRKKNFLALADYAAPFLMLSQAFVRIGCLMTGCCYGKPTGCSLGVKFKTVDDILRHPTQGYESILLFSIYMITRAVYKKNSNYPGKTFFLSLFLYGTGRFFIEFFRVDSPNFFMNITCAQAACLLLSIGSAMAAWRVFAPPEKQGVSS